MATAAWALQQTVFAALTAAPAIAAGGVYDATPEKATLERFARDALDYVVIGEAQMMPADANGVDAESDDGIESYLDIHVWSTYRGNRRALEILSAIHSRLNGVTLTVAGRGSALSWVDGQRVMTDRDGVTRHGVATLKIIHRT